jgi:Ca2+/Na+ antiporter
MLLSAMCNVFLFPGNYGLLSVTLEFIHGVGHNLKEMLFNILVMFILAVVAFMFFAQKFKRLLVVVPSLCLFAFLCMFAQNAFRIQRSYRELAAYYRPPETGAQVVEPIFHLSKTGKNIIVIMLDRAISVFIPHIVGEFPEIKDIYEGFVHYPNTVSFNGYTAIGSPPIFGGYEYVPEEVNKRTGITLKEKHNEALLMMPRIFSEAGYSITVTDAPFANYEDKPDMKIFDPIPYVHAYITDSMYTDTWIKDHGLDLPSVSSILERNILWYGIFRAAPLFLREGLYLKGSWDAPVSNRSLRLTINGYSVLDYLPELTDSSPEKENTAMIMVNNTTHENSFLQAPDYVPVVNVTNYGTSPFKKEFAYHINAAAIKRLADWFVFLKEEGLYDNSRIVLVADHGAEPSFVTKTSLPFNVEQFNPLLMVKDFDAEGPLQTDISFMSNADVPSIVFKGLIEDPVNPFTGNKITDEHKKSPLYIAISGSVHRGDSDARQYMLDPRKDYFVHDNIFDQENWERAER